MSIAAGSMGMVLKKTGQWAVIAAALVMGAILGQAIGRGIHSDNLPFFAALGGAAGMCAGFLIVLVLGRTRRRDRRGETVMKPTAARGRLSDRLWSYFALTYAISWLCWGSMVALGLPGGSVHPNAPPPPVGNLLLLTAGSLGPSVAGVYLTWRTGGRAGLGSLWRRCTQFRLGWRLYLAIFLVPLLVAAARITVQALRGGAIGPSPLLLQPLSLIGFTVQTFVFGPLVEEAGWRGFALDRLLARRGFLTGSLVLGVLHGCWHLPLYFIPGTFQQMAGSFAPEFAVFLLGGLGVAMTTTWIYVNSGRSVWSAYLFHFTYNFGYSFVWTLWQGDVADRLTGSVAILLLAALLAALPARRGEDVPVQAVRKPGFS